MSNGEEAELYHVTKVGENMRKWNAKKITAFRSLMRRTKVKVYAKAA